MGAEDNGFVIGREFGPATRTVLLRHPACILPSPVAIGISERHDGPAADVLVDSDGLTGLVVVEIQFRQAREDRLAVAQFKLRLDADLGEIEHLVGGFACSSSGELHARFGIEIFSGAVGCLFFLPATVPVNAESVTIMKSFSAARRP